MVLKYRVSLPGLKGFSRVYMVKDSTTLYTFHKQMRNDMSFPQDQMILFKGLSETGQVIARYSLIDLGCGTVDETTIGKTIKEGIVSFTYFYDTVNRKSVILTLEEGEYPLDPKATYPVLIETKGPDPEAFEHGYVAFEDLPEDKKKRLIADPDDLDDEDYDEDEREDLEADEEEELYDDED